MRRWILGIVLALMLAGGVWLRLTYVHYFPLTPDEIGGPPAAPAVLATFGDDPPVRDLEDWRSRRAPLLREAFARDVYGAMPPPLPGAVLTRLALSAERPDRGARLQQLTVGFGPDGARGKVNVVLAMPPSGTPVRALIIMQTFCGNAAALGGRYPLIRSLTPPPKYCEGPMAIASHIILGRYPDGPPLKRVIDRGYAVAIVYGGDLVPDDAHGAPPALARLYGPGVPPGGALAAWAWLYGELGEVLTREPGLTTAPVVAWGHSRSGKAALLAGAVYPSIAGVIAHQSGRGGAALTRSSTGESVRQITDAYAYWFAPRFADWAGHETDSPVDQHQLLALIAPKPVLIGAGNRDRWADPAGMFRAVQGANPVYQLYGAPTFTQTKLAAPDLGKPQAFFMRQGTHGVTTHDWTLFLDFLDAHFPAGTVLKPQGRG